jgi:hypothetical protein
MCLLIDTFNVFYLPGEGKAIEIDTLAAADREN